MSKAIVSIYLCAHFWDFLMAVDGEHILNLILPLKSIQITVNM